jgi:hypothetical protein
MMNQKNQYLSNNKLKIIEAKMYRKERMLSKEIVVLVVSKRKVKRRVIKWIQARKQRDKEQKKKMRMMMKRMKKRIKILMIKLELIKVKVRVRKALRIDNRIMNHQSMNLLDLIQKIHYLLIQLRIQELILL